MHLKVCARMCMCVSGLCMCVRMGVCVCMCAFVCFISHESVCVTECVHYKMYLFVSGARVCWEHVCVLPYTSAHARMCV